MILNKSKRCLLICVLGLITMTGCAKGETLPDMEPMPIVAIESENLPIETAMPDDGPKVYVNFIEAYLDVLAEKSLDIISPNMSDDGVIAILDVFGDETPELLYIYHHDDIRYSLKIYTYSKSEGVESVFDSIVFQAAGGGNNYCVYLTQGGELMLYRSTFNAQDSYGFWPIIQNQNLEIMIDDYGVYNFNADLAKLYYRHCVGEPDEKHVSELIINRIRYGEEIPEVQFTKIAKELMGDIEHVIFQGIDDSNVGLYGKYEFDELWKNNTPFEAECMTYAEAVAWLEAQIEKL